MGVTVVLVTCSYREKEFVRVGYYVNNEYDDDEMYNDDGTTVGGLPPKPLDMNKVRRIVLADKPRVTRFPIQWGDQTEEEAKETTPIVLGTSSSSSNDDGIMMGTVSPEEDEGMTLEELGTGKEEEEEFQDDDEDDDVSLEGNDMMGDDHLMMSNASPMTRAME